MATYTFRFPGRNAGKTVTVFDQSNTQVASGATDSNAVLTTSLAYGDYYAVAPDGQYVRGGVDSPQSVESAGLSAGFAAAGLPTWAGTRANRFDPPLNVYNWKANNTRRTAAAIARALGGGAATFGSVGDSETYGHPNGRVNSYVKYAQDVLVTLGVPNKGWLQQLPQTIPGNGWAKTGTVSVGLAFATLSSGATATYTSTNSGTIVEVPYLGNAGAFTVAIDGAAAVTVTPPGSQTYQKYTVTGLTNTTHTVVITATANNCYIIGCAVRGTTGLEWNNYGGVGSVASSTSGSSSAWDLTAFAKLQTIALNSGPAADAWFVALGVNDLRMRVAPDAFKTAMTGLVNNLSPSADVILVSELTPSNYSDASALPQSAWDAFMAAHYDLADSLNVPLIDVSNAFGTPTQANTYGLSANDGVPHPNTPGYAFMGRVIARAIGA